MKTETLDSSLLFSLKGVGVVETDIATGRFLRANQAFCEMVGYSEEELRALTYLALTHPDDRARDEARFRELQAGAQTGETSLTRVRHKDESVVWLELSITLVGEGNEIRNITVASDVSERIRAEVAQRESEARQAFLLRLSDTLRPLADPAAIQGEASRLLREHFDAGWCYYVEWDEAGTTGYVLKDNTREDLPSMVGIHDVSDAPAFTELLRSGGLLNVPDFRAFPLFNPRVVARYTGIGIYSVLGVPLVKNKRLIATLSLADTAPREWTSDAITLVTEVAERTWAALERARAEEALRASEQKYRRLFDSIDEGYCIIKVSFDEHEQPVDYRFLEANPAFEAQTGLNDPVGKTMLTMVPEHEQYWFDTYGRIALTGVPERFESRAEALGRYYDVYAFRVGEPDEHKVAVLFTDIQKRKQVEEALRASEERLQLTVQSVADHAIFTLDPERTITSWNPGAEQIFGYSAEEALGLSGDVMFTPEDREAGEPHKEATTAREQGRAVDERWHLRKNGERFFASGSVAPIWEGDTLSGYVKIARDLTKERQAEEEREMLLEAVRDLNAALERRVEERTEQLLQSERRFSQAFEVAPIPAVISTLGQEKFLEVNEAFLQLTGYGREEVIGKNAFELGMWSSREDQRKLAAAQQDGAAFRNLELSLSDKDHQPHDILLSAEVIQLDGGTGYLKMFYDITERKKNDEQMHMAIQSIMNDASWFSQEVIARLNHIRTAGNALGFEHIDLSPREREVLERLAVGWNNERIAEDLGLKTQTVRNYISNIYDKIGVNSRTEAAVWARERGFTGK